jgi:predicted O-linked N-acetylglucosamine transferase (SPINDLY family)
MFGAILALNKDNLFDKFIDNEMMASFYIRCNMSEHNYKDSVTLLLKLIQSGCKKKSITQDDKSKKWGNYHDLGYIYCTMGEIESSIQYTKKAAELANKFNLTLAHRMLSFDNYVCFHDFLYYNHSEIFDEHLKINDYFPDTKTFPKRTKPNNKIRIGYLSSDFYYHAVVSFIYPILLNHNQDLFEIFLFPCCPKMEDIIVDLKYKSFNISELNDKDAATLINRCSIDILFDLNGHTVNNRLGIFSYNPAPVQISYLGFPNTTGLKSIKYRITDEIADNKDTLQKYSEELIRLPKCFLLYKSVRKNTPSIPRVTNNNIILGALNKENKNSKQYLDILKKIMVECPNVSVLFKLSSYDNKEERMKHYKEILSVNENRIIIINKLSNEDYNNKLFTMFDILLDTFPYSGTTTTCNALYNSVPVVTMYNKDYHVHNVSSSILMNCGLKDLVAYSEDEYVSIIKGLVTNKELLDYYKKRIHEQFVNSMDPNDFMPHYENALIDVFNKKI